MFHIFYALGLRPKLRAISHDDQADEREYERMLNRSEGDMEEQELSFEDFVRQRHQGSPGHLESKYYGDTIVGDKVGSIKLCYDYDDEGDSRPCWEASWNGKREKVLWLNWIGDNTSQLAFAFMKVRLDDPT